MKKALIILSLISILLACKNESKTLVSAYPVHFLLNLPIGNSVDYKLSNASLTITDLNMNRSSLSTWDSLSFPCVLNVELPVGLYNADFKATLTIDSFSYVLIGYYRNCTVTNEATFEAKASIQSDERNFVLAEIFFSGTLTPQGKQYLGDKYFVVYNNSFDTLYADGLILMESKLKNSVQIGLDPDFRSNHYTVDAMYRIPGSGKEMPIEPGGALLIVDNAMDHTAANPNSFDLSMANFEWYDVSTSATVTDVNNPAIPNMDKIYCYTLTIWTPNNQGNTTFALGRLPDSLSAEDYLSKYKYTYDYTTTTQAGTFEMSADTYLFPNEWIIDAVNLCPSQKYQWLTSPSLDAGYAFVAATGSDTERYGRSVRRKTEFIYNNRPILADTNNSSADFEAVAANPTIFIQNK